MRKCIGVIVFLLFLCMPCGNAGAFLVTLNEQDRMDALQKGKEQGGKVIKYIKQNYSFGGKEIFEETGVIKTKWSQLMLLAGLMAEKNVEPTKQEQTLVVESRELQIDIHSFGDRMDFANDYKVHLVQKGKRIEAEKISANDVAYSPKKGSMSSGFPRYRATILSYFSYDKISPDEKAEIVLVKDKKEVVFEVNFADYK